MSESSPHSSPPQPPAPPQPTEVSLQSSAESTSAVESTLQVPSVGSLLPLPPASSPQPSPQPELVSPQPQASPQPTQSSPPPPSSSTRPDIEMIDVDTANAASTLDEQHFSPTHQATGGALLAFGCGMFGLLGTADDSNRPQPAVVDSFASKTVTSVAAGASHALAVDASGSVYSWGDNSDGALGVGDYTSRSKPTEVTSLQAKICVATAAGFAHSLALTKTGELFAFGQGEMAQLGLTVRKRPKNTPPDLASHPTPSLVRELAALTRIIAIACGENHSLALSSAGRVYSVGDGSRGALGFDFSAKTKATGGPSLHSDESHMEVGGGVRIAVFTELTSLQPIPIASIAAGAHHSLFVSAGGSVYSCGDASKGRLGYTLPSANGHVQWMPKRIEIEEHVINASAGTQYSLFLTQDHTVYATGSNAHGECGFGEDVITIETKPRKIPSLRAIIQISAGATHALARDAENRVWSFGSGENGELGQSEKDLPKRSTAPGVVALPRLWPHQHVVSVSAGSNTSYVIVAQTVLAATALKSPTPSATPTRKRIRPYASSNASADGSKSTAVATSYQLYSALPDAPKFSFADVDADVEMADASPSSVAASLPVVPQFVVAPSQSPLPLSTFSYTHFDGLLKRKDYPALVNYVAHCFSSALVLNASFYPSQAVGGGHHIDCTLLEQVYQRLLKAALEQPKVQQVLGTSLQKMLASMVLLFKQQGRKPPKDITAYRCIFIALQSPHLLNATRAESQLLTDVAYVLTRIPREVMSGVDNIFSHIPTQLLEKRFIRCLLANLEFRMKSALTGAPPTARLRHATEDMQAIVAILDGIYCAVQKRQERLSLLSGVDGVGSETTSLVPETAFHFPVSRYMDLQSDLEAYCTPAPTAAQLPPFSFMRYPYLLAPAQKVAYLRLEFAISMQQMVLGAALSGVNPQLELTVRRNNLVEDTVNALNRYNIWELRRPLKVQFEGELGEDQGGLTSEFFELTTRQFFQPQYQLFEVRREWKTYWFSSLPMDPSKASLYEIFGRLLGLSVYNGTAVHLNLPIWLYAQLLGKKPTLKDLKQLDSQLANSLEEVLRFEGDIENTLCLDFTITIPDRTEEEINAEMHAVQGTAHNASQSSPHLLMESLTRSTSEALSRQTSESSTPMLIDDSSDSTAVVPSRPRRVRNVPLLPGGEDMPVTQANKAQYVQMYVDFLLTTSVRDALQPMIEGFQSIVGRVRHDEKKMSRVQSETAAMGLFSASDLEVLMTGVKETSFEELKKGTRYEGYTPDHPTIRDFWSIVLEELTPKEQRSLLLFTTGSSRAPIGGLAEVRMLIQRAGPDSDNLPTSSTCFHALLLPQYATKDKLREKLKLALANAVGFGLR